MIDRGFLEAFRLKIGKGGSLHRHEQLQLVIELIALQEAVETRNSRLEVQNGQLQIDVRALRIQVQELNETIQLLSPKSEEETAQESTVG